jgi:hypothetical protein
VSDDLKVRALAFVKDGRVTLVLFNDQDSVQRSASIDGLAPASYGLSRAVGSSAYTELGVQTVNTTGALTVTMPGNSVVTLYPLSGTNQPPTVTDWKTTQAHLKLPASSTTLTAAAQDPELDPITWRWTVKSAPAGAAPVLATPNTANCSVSGLSVAGTYAFDVAVSDPTHTLHREVRITVYATNQPPFLFDVHNRVVLEWPSVPGHFYSVEKAAALHSAAWTSLVIRLPANPPVNTLSVPVEAEPAAYFRVKLEP